MNNLYLN